MILHRFTVTQPAPLLEFLLDALKSQSRSSVKSFLHNGQVTVNDVIATQFDLPLAYGNSVAIMRKGRKQIDFHHNMMSIVWMDEDLVVINKEEGLLSVSSTPAQKITAYYILSEYFQSLDPHNRLYVLHRLDKGTSGLMMFARTLEAQHTLRDNWHSMITSREYIAVVEGAPPQMRDTIVTYLNENKRMKVYCTDPQHGKQAITHYEMINQGSGYSMLRLMLETGRKNQIRAQMEYLGCPVCGDPKYGSRTDPCGRLMLHASRLNFIHPRSGEEMKFELNAPEDFYRVV
ncbi:MAG: RluA family pseudouridine synthase [Tannerella sp.]|jgi:23S rRNA pseudouridine1911/1915/1917 synthase|nr:RluA family pseudouridine synthase [Tannerella sp.]